MTTPEQPTAPQQSRLRQLLAPLVAAGATVLKFGAVIVKLKFFALGFSMIASMWAYALLYGWQFGIGFVLLILVHEMGHVIVLRARGIPAGLPVFIPFLGAVVSMKAAPRSAYDEALSGIAGPVLGTVGAFGVLAASGIYDSELLRVLGYTGLFLNLFNLLPVLPLDGGRTAAALSPKLWGLGLVLLLGYEIVRPSPVIPIILVFGGLELYRRRKGTHSDYYALTAQQRLQIGSLYVGLITVILWGMHSYPLPPR